MNYEVEILLVEDNMNDAELAIRALKKNNLANKLVHLEDGQEALDFIFAEGNYSNRKVGDIPKVNIARFKNAQNKRHSGAAKNQIG